MAIGDARWIETHGDVHACETAADRAADRMTRQDNDNADATRTAQPEGTSK